MVQRTESGFGAWPEYFDDAPPREDDGDAAPPKTAERPQFVFVDDMSIHPGRPIVYAPPGALSGEAQAETGDARNSFTLGVPELPNTLPPRLVEPNGLARLLLLVGLGWLGWKFFKG
jgi:hypothetical protein